MFYYILFSFFVSGTCLKVPLFHKHDQNTHENYLYNLLELSINTRVSVLNQHLNDHDNVLAPGIFSVSPSFHHYQLPHQINMHCQYIILRILSIMVLYHYENNIFKGRIGIGTPPQYLITILDTGSSNLWVASSLCRSIGCVIHSSYKHDRSSTFQSIGFDINVKFGTGSIRGTMATDTFTIGSLIVPNQPFGEIYEESGSVFTNTRASGILGLGFSAVQSPLFLPVFDNIVNQKLITFNCFSFYLSHYPSQSSAVFFGPPNPSLYIEPIEYVNVYSNLYWASFLNDLVIKSVSFIKNYYPNNYVNNLNHSSHSAVVVDTGTSLITLPSDNKHFVLTPSDYMVSKRDTDGRIIGCKAGLMPLDVPSPKGPLFILGDLFIRKYYSVFDRDNMRMGFAIAKK